MLLLVVFYHLSSYGMGSRQSGRGLKKNMFKERKSVAGPYILSGLVYLCVYTILFLRKVFKARVFVRDCILNFNVEGKVKK